MQLTVRQPSASQDAKHYTTERLRSEYLIETVFVPDDAILTYSHFDRIIAGGVMVGMNYLGGSMAAEEESIPQTSTVKVTAKAEDSDAVVAVAREAMPSVVTISRLDWPKVGP